MNETDRVTTDKPKNPGRQEWGRTLGKIQKNFKANKQKDMQELLGKNPDSSVKTNSFMKWEYGVAILGLSIGIVALYYQKRSRDMQSRSSQSTGSSRDMQPPNLVENSQAESGQAGFSDF